MVRKAKKRKVRTVERQEHDWLGPLSYTHLDHGSNSILVSVLSAMTWQAKGGALGHAGLRKDYWVHMQEARERLQRENPGASKREVLKMAVTES